MLAVWYYGIVRFQTDVISVRLGRSLSRQELLALTQSEATAGQTDTTAAATAGAMKRSPPVTAATTTALISVPSATSTAATAVQWKFLCIEGYNLRIKNTLCDVSK